MNLNFKCQSWKINKLQNQIIGVNFFVKFFILINEATGAAF